MNGGFPVIDIAAMRQPLVSAAARREIARRIASACEEIGFFAVTGHGVPGAVTDYRTSRFASTASEAAAE